MRVVIDVSRDYNPQDGDMLVYDKAKNMWVCEQKSYILKEQDKIIASQNEKIAKMEAEEANFIKEANARINVLAEAVKGIL